MVHIFTGADGASPQAGLTRAADGDLYGTTARGGRYDRGTVFRLTPARPGSGAYTFETLYSFGATAGDAVYPNTDLVVDAHGRLIGTAYTCCVASGTAFMLTPPAGAGEAWTDTVLHRFVDKRGAAPQGVIMGANGALYGVARGGGAFDEGTAFALIPDGASYRFAVIDEFGSSPDVILPPIDRLTAGAHGVLYGVTSLPASVAGTDPSGVIFALSPPAKMAGAWTATALYTYNSFDAAPRGSLVRDAAGVLYGVTDGGKPGCPDPDHRCGTAFALAPPMSAGQAWSYATIYASAGTLYAPVPGLRIDDAGHLYGAASHGGFVAFNTPPPGYEDTGGLYSLSPPSGRSSMSRARYFYPHGFRSGAVPMGDVLVTHDGSIVVTTAAGGDLTGCNCGSVVRLSHW